MIESPFERIVRIRLKRFWFCVEGVNPQKSVRKTNENEIVVWPMKIQVILFEEFYISIFQNKVIFNRNPNKLLQLSSWSFQSIMLIQNKLDEKKLKLK